MDTSDLPVIQRLSPEGLVASPAFSHVAVLPSEATTILVGGQNGVDATGKVVGDDLASQTEQVFDNLETALAAAGAGLADVVQLRLLLVAGHDLRPGYEVFQRRWDPAVPPPLVTGAFVAGLAVPGALVEVEAVAAVIRDPAGDPGWTR